MIDLCAECLAVPCVCAALEAGNVLRALPPRATLLERAEAMGQFDTEWQIYRERSRDAVDRIDRVEVIRDPRLTTVKEEA